MLSFLIPPSWHPRNTGFLLSSWVFHILGEAIISGCSGYHTQGTSVGMFKGTHRVTGPDSRGQGSWCSFPSPHPTPMTERWKRNTRTPVWGLCCLHTPTRPPGLRWRLRGNLSYTSLSMSTSLSYCPETGLLSDIMQCIVCDDVVIAYQLSVLLDCNLHKVGIVSLLFTAVFPSP